MNNVRKVFWTALTLLLAIIVLIWLKKKPEMPNVELSAGIANQSNMVNSISTQKIAQANANIPIQANSTAKAQTALPTDEMRRLAALARNVSIDFWGKVIDQNNVPLSGVKVVASPRTFVVETNGLPYTEFPKINLVTRPDGIFEIHGITGDVLTIETMEKEGYETDSGTLRSFDYNLAKNITPDPDNPIIFRIWQKGLKQSSLISGDKVTKIIPDGRSYAIDFTKGIINEAKDSAGDLLIKLKRPDNVQRGEKFDWSFTIILQNGGLLQDMQTPFAAMTLAPTDGYEDAYTSQHYANDNGWKAGETNKRFYIKMRNGQAYGRIEIAVNSGLGEMRIQYVVNASGSPILR